MSWWKGGGGSFSRSWASEHQLRDEAFFGVWEEDFPVRIYGDRDKIDTRVERSATLKLTCTSVFTNSKSYIIIKVIHKEFMIRV